MRSVVLACVAFAVALAVDVAAMGPAAAHTGLQSSDPADGAVVDGPIDEATLEFSGTPTAIDDGIVVADAAGVSYLPVDVLQDGNRIVARFDPPLGDGAYVLAWVIRSSDTHTIDGSIAFEVTDTPAPTTTEPSSSSSSTSQPPSTTTSDESEAPDHEVTVAGGASPPPTPPALVRIDEGEATAQLGRLVLFPAAVAAIGMLAFSGVAFAGRESDRQMLDRLVRGLGAAVAVGAGTELAGLNELFEGLTEMLEGSSGGAAAARLLAGGLLALGGRGRTGLVGAGILIGSFAFDGHTVSEGPRLLHGAASVAHVGAASVWAGGVVALTVVIWRRHHDGVDSHATEMIVRFSTIAAGSVAIAGAAGLVMAWFIVDEIGVPTTEWGRRMLVKILLVGVAVSIGGYNRFRLSPALMASPKDSTVLGRAQSVLAVEAVVLTLVALTTALLVAASTL